MYRLALVVFLALFSLPALSTSTQLMNDSNGMNGDSFGFAVDNKGFLAVDRTGVLPHLQIAAGLTLDFAFDQWVAAALQDRALYDNTFLKWQGTAILSFNLGLFDFASVGFRLPAGMVSGQMAVIDDGGDGEVSLCWWL